MLSQKLTEIYLNTKNDMTLRHWKRIMNIDLDTHLLLV